MATTPTSLRPPRPRSRGNVEDWLEDAAFVALMISAAALVVALLLLIIVL